MHSCSQAPASCLCQRACATLPATQQASAAAAAEQYDLAESLYLKAKRPEGALAMYRHAARWQDALRIAEAYLPGKLQVRVLPCMHGCRSTLQLSPAACSADTLSPDCCMPCCLQELHLEMASSMPAAGAGGTQAAVARGRAYEQGHDYARAIDAYLSVEPADSSDLGALQQCWEQVRQVQETARRWLAAASHAALWCRHAQSRATHRGC